MGSDSLLRLCRAFRITAARFSVIATALVLACSAGSASALTLFVSTTGSDAADGLTPKVSGGSGPLATVSGALSRLATLGGIPAEADVIRILPGTYYLASTIRIGTSNVRNPDRGLVIEAQEPGSVILSGGRLLGPARKKGGLWEIGGVTDPIQMVWANDARAVRARSPNGGLFYTGGRNVNAPVPEQRFLSVTKPENIENTHTVILPEGAQAALRQALASKDSLQDVAFYALHSWTSSAQEIKSFDAERGILRVAPRSHWPFFQFSPNQRFAFDNHSTFLDEPGEWLQTAAGVFRYVPHPAQRIESTRFVAARLERLLEASGSPGLPLRGVVLRGLRFSHSSAKLSPFIDGQAMLVAPPAVSVEYARGIEIDDCAFEHIGGYALALRRGVSESTVRRSLFDDLGAGGIRLGAAAVSSAPDDATTSNLIQDNIVRNGGVVFPGGVGIWIGQSGGNRVLQNEVHSLNYTGISVGWTWAYGASGALKNTIASNYIHDVGMGTLDDLGAIYLLGRTDGTEVTGNRIEDVTSFSRTGATAWGIYLDAGSSDVVVQNNLVLRTTGGGFHLHYGRRNLVRNNIFAYGLLGEAKRTAKGEDASLMFESNLLVGESGDTFVGNWNDASAKVSSNLVSGKERLVRARVAVKEGRLNNEQFVDKQVANLQCSNGECTVDSSAASAVGFKMFSTSLAGVRSRGAILKYR